MNNILYKFFSVNTKELALLAYSFFFMFLLFASYAILRPLRDALGLEGDTVDLKWLFLATFILIILASLAAMWISSRLKRMFYINAIFIFFISNLFIFYIAMQTISSDSVYFLWLCRSFYVWVSIFNLFIISSAWSLLADVFTKDFSKRMFAMIAAGASLGNIMGAYLVSVLAASITVDLFIFISILFLLFSLILKKLIISEGFKFNDKVSFEDKFQKPIGSKNPFEGFKLIIKSKYLMALLGFILLLTSVSTFLYMEQARMILDMFPTRKARIQAFANIDLIVQSLSFFIQIFLTAKIVQFFGIKWLLSLLGFVLTVVFVIMALMHYGGLAEKPESSGGIYGGYGGYKEPIHRLFDSLVSEPETTYFYPIVLIIAMVIRRVGEYALVKPGREMLFVPLDSDSKYKVKNFLDTVVYRGGDALSSQLEGALAKISIALTLFAGAFISFIWGLLGLFLSRSYEKNKY